MAWYRLQEYTIKNGRSFSKIQDDFRKAIQELITVSYIFLETLMLMVPKNSLINALYAKEPKNLQFKESALSEEHSVQSYWFEGIDRFGNKSQDISVALTSFGLPTCTHIELAR